MHTIQTFLIFALVTLIPLSAAAKPVHHYVFFAMDREKIKDSRLFFETPALEGAQVAYSWRQLEPQKDKYDFSFISEDLNFLRTKGKKLFVQIQDVSFYSKYVHVPRYLREEPLYSGGADRQYPWKKGQPEETAQPAGWMARRWDPAVRERFHKLLAALGKEFDGRIAGVNLSETSCEFGESGKLFPTGFTHQSYRDGIIENMRALRNAFPKSVVLIYANFMPGDWLPTQDNGYLRSVYKAATQLNVGIGGPDVFPYKPGQMNNSYHLIRASAGKVKIGMAVQDGNYEHINPKSGKRVTARDILEFATGYLKTDYLFWGIEEPFYTQETIPFLRTTK